MAITRSQTASQARTPRAASTATARRQRPAKRGGTTAPTTTNNQRRLPRILLRLGPCPTPAEEALAIARHNRLVGRPHIILRLSRPPPAAAQERQANARPGSRPRVTLRMGFRPTAAEERQARARHDRLVGLQRAILGLE